MGTTCLIKDENYYKVLEALDYDEKKLAALQIAYEKAGLEFPTLEQLIKEGKVIPKQKDYFTPIQKFYQFAKIKYNKLNLAILDEIKSIENSLKLLEPNSEEYNREKEKLEKLKINKLLIKQRIESLDNAINNIKKQKKAYIENTSKSMSNMSAFSLTEEGFMHEEEKKLFFHNYNVVLRELSAVDFEFINTYLEKNTLNSSMLVVIRNTLESWKAITKLENNPIYSNEELDSFLPGDLAVLTQINMEATRLLEKFNNISKNIILKELEENYGDNVSSHVSQITKDLSGAESLFLSLSEYNNPITNYIWFLGKKASLDTQKELEAKLKIIEKISKVFSRFSNNELKEMLLQDSADGTYKIPKLRTMYSQLWYNRFGNLLNRLNEALQNGNINYLKNTAAKIHRNSFVISSIELFDENGELKNDDKALKIIQDLNTLPSVVKEKILKKLKYKALKYYREEKIARDEFNLLYKDNEKRREEAFQEWLRKNNPTNQKKLLDIDVTAGSIIDIKFLNTSYLEIIPRHIVGNGKNTKFYDSKYIELLNNKELAEALYEMEELLTELKMYLPPEHSNVTFNSIPFIANSLINNLLESGITNVLPNFWQNLLNDISVSNENNIVSEVDVRPDGTIRPKVVVKGLSFMEYFIDDYINKQFVIFKIHNNIDSHVTQEDLLNKKEYENERAKYFNFLAETKKKASQELIEKMNFDLGNLLKVYAAAVLTYKSKTKVEDTVLAMRDYLANSIELATTSSGKPKITSKGKVVTKEHGLEQLLKAVDFHIHVMFGHEKASPEMILNKKVYNKQEKQTKEVIDEKIEELDEKFKNNQISEDEYLNQRIALQNELFSLGRNVSAANIIDLINNYIRIRGLGWNAISPISNINVAFFANLIEASRNKYLDTGNLLRGYKLFFTEREKVKNIFEKIITLQTVQNELYNKSKTQKTKVLHPMYLTESAEFFNQAPLVVGYFLSTKVIVNGKETTLYDIIDDNGNLMYDEASIKFVDKKDKNIKFNLALIKARTDWLISRVHGNYDPDSPIRAEGQVIYRSLLVFRKWIINSFLNRIQPETHNWIMNETEKGRWRSYGNFFDTYGVLGGTFVIAAATVKAMFFSKTNFSQLSDLDAQNMRANITEIIFLAYITIIGSLLYGLMGSDDDDEEEEVSKIRFALIFTTNILGRLTRDITLYMDPDQFKSMLRDPIPIWGLVNDLTTVIGRTINIMNGKPDNKTDYQWDKYINTTIKKAKSFLPYGFNTLDKLKTFATKKSLY